MTILRRKCYAEKVEHLEQEIEELMQFSPDSTFETQAGTGEQSRSAIGLR